MFENHEKVTFTDFRGLFNRGNINAVPLTHAITAMDCVFNKNEVLTRGAFKRSVNDGESIYLARDIFQYFLAGGGTSYLASAQNAGFSNIFDTSTIPPTSILIILDWDGRFSAVQVGTRVYIMPYSLSTAKLYVWEVGGAEARLSSGAKPTVAPTAATGAVGNGDAGFHAIQYAWETSTGFITGPSPAVVYNSAGAVTIDVAAIANGPVGTIAKHVLMTKAKTTAALALTAEYFMVGKISDNVTLTFNINKFDSELSSSADYLIDQLAEIPNARGVAYYENKLVVFGLREDRNLIKVSRPNEPESFDSVDGNIVLSPKIRNGVYGVAEYHGLMYIFCAEKTLVTQDSGGIPSEWDVSTVDSSVGIAVIEYLDMPSRAIGHYRGIIGSTVDDVLIVGTNTGIRIFNGSYGDYITFNIESQYTWSNWDNIIIDVPNKRLFSYQTGSENTLLYGDYSEGLTGEAIKWSIWNIHSDLLDYDGNLQFTIDNIGTMYLWTGRLRYIYTSNKHSDGSETTVVPIYWRYQFAPAFFNYGWVHHFTGLVITGWFDDVAYNVDVLVLGSGLNLVSSTPITIPLIFTTESIPRINTKHRLINYISDALSLTLGLNNPLAIDLSRPDMEFRVSRVDIYGYPLWAHRVMDMLPLSD